MSHRHQWGPPVNFPYKTERSCLRPGCPVVKVTRHEPGELPWREWWRHGEQLEGALTPPCEGAAVPPPVSRPSEVA